MNTTIEMQLYRLIYYSWLALRVLGDVFAHHQEQLTVFTASGNVHQCCCWLVSWKSYSSMTPASSAIGEHYQKL
jgi:hypothetical protein